MTVETLPTDDTHALPIAARLRPGETLSDRIIRIDHAGEQGAVCVYRAQCFFAPLRAAELLERLRDYLLHEKRHRSVFGGAMMRRGLKRSSTYAICSIGGYVLGTVTALLGRRAIAVTTMALEDSVMRRLRTQRERLAARDPELAALIDAVIDDERREHDRSLDRMEVDTGPLRLLHGVIARSTGAVVWLGMKL